MFTMLKRFLDRSVDPVTDIKNIWSQLCTEYGIDTELNFVYENNDVASSLATHNSLTIAVTKAEVRIGKYTKKTLVVVNGVDLVCKQVIPTLTKIKKRNKKYESKLNELTTILRHEIGHVLSFKEKYSNLTKEELNKLNEYIDVNRMALDVPVKDVYSGLVMYLNQPLEKWANEAAGISNEKLINDAIEFFKE